jgi:hypothetical protein
MAKKRVDLLKWNLIDTNVAESTERHVLNFMVVIVKSAVSISASSMDRLARDSLRFTI